MTDMLDGYCNALHRIEMLLTGALLTSTPGTALMWHAWAYAIAAEWNLPESMRQAVSDAATENARLAVYRAEEA